MKRTFLALALLLPVLAACNTMQGIGADTAAGGKAIENSADKNKDY